MAGVEAVGVVVGEEVEDVMVQLFLSWSEVGC